jgi:hypothetical protein
MSRAFGKFIAVMLAIWLPLFSGNVLAVSIAMQSPGGDCHPAVAQQDEPHCASTVQQRAHHDQLAADQEQSTGQQNPAGEDCGTCHFACCGYLAAASVEVPGDQPSALLYLRVSAQFQSITSTPLDPPPLARS